MSASNPEDKKEIIPLNPVSGSAKGPALSNTEPTPLYYVQQGQGSAFTFTKTPLGLCITDPDSGKNFKYIGTEKCTNSVGLYFQITGSRCFCANIDIVLNAKNHKPSKPRDFKTVKDAVILRLKKHAQSHNWEPKHVMKETLIIVCSYAHQLSLAAIAGIQEFLGLEGPPDFHRDNHGFMVELSDTGNSSAKLLHFNVKDPESSDRMHNLDPRHELKVVKWPVALEEGEWRYICDRGWDELKIQDREDRARPIGDIDVKLENWLAGLGKGRQME